MILLSNVKITNIPLYPSPNRHLLRGKLFTNPDRMDIWKYTLASYVPLMPLISKVILYIDLATTEYAGQEPLLETYIRSLFPEDKLILRWYRNNSTADWRRSCEEDVFPIDDDLIFNLTNDDHVFIDKNLDILNATINHLTRCEDPYAQIIYSHWPEVIRHAANNGFQISEDLTCVYGRFRSIESFDIVKKERWRHYWFDHDFGEANNVFRPDEHLCVAGTLPHGSTVFFPIRELSRHFDGYEYAGAFMNLAPPLDIPQGFFEKNIKIAYGYSDLKEGYTNINPSYPYFKASTGIGMDYRFSLEDIPAAWFDRISEISINPNADLEYLKKCRDQLYYDMACADARGPHVQAVTHPFPKEIFKNQFLSKQ
jgi:hypothetical protein